MRRALIILIIGLFTAFLFSNALAIERVSKKDTSVSKEQSEHAKPAPAPEKKEGTAPEKPAARPEPVPVREQPREGEVRKPQKEREEGTSRILRESKKALREERRDRYDYFIDKNGNGIDDRLEQQGKSEKKPVERKAPPPEKKERRAR